MKIDHASGTIVPPIEYLRECFRYDPESGKLFWKERPLSHFPNEKAKKTFEGRGYVGKEFGHTFNQKTTGRVASVVGRLIYQGKGYSVSAHRVIWMILYGPIPFGYEIDHINRDASDNRLINLRLASHSQNIANSTDYRQKKDGLPRGVYKNGKKYSAMIRKDKKLTYIGTYATPELAREAYIVKAKEVHGEFFNG